VTTGGKHGDGWTAVLRRPPAGIVDGQPQGGYAKSFEIICPNCGDDPGTDYREISAELRQVRGSYPITDGIAAYDKHLRQRQQLGRHYRLGPPTDAGWRR
jgi:hypothetical protein